MSKQVDVVCIKHGTRVYDWSYVDKLYRGVSRSFTDNVNFTVFTDVVDNSLPYNQVQLPNIPGLEGREKGKAAWWYKMWLFSNDHPIQKQLIYFDLDVMLTGNCDFLTEVECEGFGMVEESKWSRMFAPQPRKLYNTSVMVINPTIHSFAWRRYNKSRELIQSTFHGDQNYINYLINRDGLIFSDYIVALDPKKVVYWFWDVVNGGLVNRTVNKYEDDRNGTIKVRDAVDTWRTPGVDKVNSHMSVVIFDGYKNRPDLLANRPVVKEYWV